METPPPPYHRPFRRLPVAAATVAVLALGACSPTLTVETRVPQVRVTAQSTGSLWIVRIPGTRPVEGVEVHREGQRSFRIPPGHYPPPGQCRIWRPDVPPGQQEEPGPCPDLERRVPEGSYLVYG